MATVCTAFSPVLTRVWQAGNKNTDKASKEINHTGLSSIKENQKRKTKLKRNGMLFPHRQ
jgi:hypothetical protein